VTNAGAVRPVGSAFRPSIAGSASSTDSGRMRTANRIPDGRPSLPGSKGIDTRISVPAGTSGATDSGPKRTPRSVSVGSSRPAAIAAILYSHCGSEA